MLERSAGKLARCVLRGPGRSDLAWLPGGRDKMEALGSMISKCTLGMRKSALMRLAVIQLLGLALMALILSLLVRIPEDVEG
jgi:hypothetical protein